VLRRGTAEYEIIANIRKKLCKFLTDGGYIKQALALRTTENEIIAK
jgi:hypothetical protein